MMVQKRIEREDHPPDPSERRVSHPTRKRREEVEAEARVPRDIIIVQADTSD